jgi:hypothetical protein
LSFIDAESLKNRIGRCKNPSRAYRRGISVYAAAGIGIPPKLFWRVTPLEQRVLLLPAMQLVAGGTLDWIHLLDGQGRESRLVHREASVDQLARRRAFDDDPVQRLLDSV